MGSRTWLGLAALAPLAAGQDAEIWIGGRRVNDASGDAPLSLSLPLGSCGIAATCSAPMAPPGGVAWDGTHVWAGSFAAGDVRLHRIDPLTCAVERSIPAPDRFIGGLAWDGEALWCLPEQTGQIFRVDPTDGTVLHVIPAPSVGASDPNGSGLAWDGAFLWHADYSLDQIFRLDPLDGRVVQAFPAPGTRPAGVGYSGGRLVVADALTGEIFVMDAMDGAVIESCPAPGGQPWGLAVDGQGDAWNASSSTASILLVDLDLGPFYRNYCSSTPNSTGFAATIAARGDPSMTVNDLELDAFPVPNQRGLFYYGQTQTEAPFDGAIRCLGGRVFRLPQAMARAQHLAQRVDLARPPAREGLITVGSTWSFQAWFLDPAGRFGRFNTSDGLEITFVP